MTTEIDPSSRVQVLNVPVMAPGICMLCGIADGDNRTFVDFGKQVEWYGAVYFCSECFGEIARALRWIPVAEYNELLEQHKKASAIYEISVTSNRKITDALRVVFSELGREPESVDDYIRNLMASVEESTGPETDNGHTDKRESETNESGSVEGSDDLFDSSDFVE